MPENTLSKWRKRQQIRIQKTKMLIKFLKANKFCRPQKKKKKLNIFPPFNSSNRQTNPRFILAAIFI